MHRRFDWQYIYIYKKTRWFRTPFPTWQDQFSQKESGDSISKVQTFQKTQPPQFPQRRIGHPPRNPPIFPRQTEGNMSQGLQGRTGSRQTWEVSSPPTFVFYPLFGLFSSCSLNRSFYSHFPLPCHLWQAQVLAREKKLFGEIVCETRVRELSTAVPSLLGWPGHY